MKMPLSPRLALLALLTLPLAACEGTGLPGFGAQDDPQAEGHRGPPSVSPLEAPIETGAAEARAVATAEAQTHNTAAFSARGNEPFWAVDVAGNTAIYKTPSNQRGQAIRVNRLTFAEGVEYIGVLGGRPFTVNIRAAECRDSMSGDRFPMTATLTVSGRSERGCAGPATAEVAQAVAATRAPAPAAPRATA
ncbi:COG3650 family protein, partial [Paracoccus siganidrum]